MMPVLLLAKYWDKCENDIVLIDLQKTSSFYHLLNLLYEHLCISLCMGWRDTHYCVSTPSFCTVYTVIFLLCYLYNKYLFFFSPLRIIFWPKTHPIILRSRTCSIYRPYGLGRKARLLCFVQGLSFSLGFLILPYKSYSHASYCDHPNRMRWILWWKDSGGREDKVFRLYLKTNLFT